MTITQESINASLQVGVALILSVIVWLITWLVLLARKRGRVNYLSWVGFTMPNGPALRLTVLTMLVLIPLTIATSVYGPLRDISVAEGTVAYQVQQMGLASETFIVILILAIFKTSLSEEIVFRGIIAKRLINWWGFQVGNLVQALLFMAIHLPLLFLDDTPEFQASVAALLIVRLTMSGWLMGWLNYRAGGSILPSWILHGSMNAIFYPVLAFVPLGL